MGETSGTNAALEVSVSFGRFANDSLSWEKWSTFSPNKYLEEVEKCKTPGSVAEKKAYFEAHYKKIAARKAEFLDQEKQMESGSIRSGGDENGGGQGQDANEDVYETDTLKDWNSAKGIQIDPDNITGTHCGMVEEPNEDDMITIECHASFTGGQDESESFSNKTKTEEPEEDNVIKEVFVQEVIYTNESQADVKEIQKDAENLEEDNAVKEVVLEEAISPRKSQPNEKGIQKDFGKPGENAAKEVTVQEAISSRKSKPDVNKFQKDIENVMIKTPQTRVAYAKMNQPNNSQKVNVVSKERRTPTAKKKLAPPLVKSPQVTTPRVTRPIPYAGRSSALSSSSKPEVSPSVSRNTTCSAGGSRKAVPKSLHTSISLGSTNTPLSTPSTARKSFIMESMGNKDIVRRAFKMFRNNRDQLKLSSEETAKLVPSSGTEQKLSASVTKGEVDGRSPSKSGTSVGKGCVTVSSTANTRNDKYGERRKESMKKLEVNNAVKTSPQAKSKDVKEEATRMQGRSPYLKIEVPGHSGQERLKSRLQKVGYKNALNR